MRFNLKIVGERLCDIRRGLQHILFDIDKDNIHSNERGELVLQSEEDPECYHLFKYDYDFTDTDNLDVDNQEIEVIDPS